MLQIFVKVDSCESRTDIDVNCDEIRAAMSNITLPPSAIPSWASEIPEAQWTSYLTARINSLQEIKKSN